MSIPSSDSKVLSKLLESIKSIDVRFSDVRVTLREAETNLRNAEHAYKAIASVYEKLRIERNRLLCELRGQGNEDIPDILSSTILSNVNSSFSDRKLRELREADIVFMGDLAQAKVIRSHGRPLSIHPRLPSGTWREAGVPVVGAKTIVYLETVLAKQGLSFEMFFQDWIRPIDLEKLSSEIRTQNELLDLEAEKLLKKIPGGAPWAVSRYRYHDGEPAILVGELVQMSEREVLRLGSIGPKELGYIKQILLESGLSLDMKLPDWVRPQK